MPDAMKITPRMPFKPRRNLPGLPSAAQEISQPIMKDGQFYVKNGAVYRHHKMEGDSLIMAPDGFPVLDSKLIADTREKRETLMRLKLLIDIRDTVRSILRKQEQTADENIQVNVNPPWAQDQLKLQRLYENFIHAYGPINRTEIRKTGSQDETGSHISFTVQPNLKKFRKDPDGLLVASIEIYDEATNTAKPGPIFTERVLAARGRKPVIKSARDALRHVLNTTGVFDIEATTLLLPAMAPQAIVAELAQEGLIILNPETNKWETSEHYLSGDIRAKLKRARVVAAINPDFAPAIAALEKVKPVDVKFADIDFTLGVPWMATNLIEKFGREVLGIRDIKVLYLAKTHKWFVTGTDGKVIEGAKLLEAALNYQEAAVSVEDDGSEDREFENLIADEKTQNQQLKKQNFFLSRQKLEKTFRNWIKKDAGRIAEIESLYNDIFNSEVTPAYDGSHLTLPGASVALKPYAHQLNVVRRNIVRGNTLIAHAGGAGKTLDAIIGCMERRRLGLTKKEVIVTANNLLGDVSRTFMSKYPNAHVLVLEPDAFDGDGHKLTARERIEKFVHRAATQDWDAIIMTQASFDRFEVSRQKKFEIMLDDIQEFQAYAALPDYRNNPRIQKHLGKIILRKFVQLEEFLKESIQPHSMPKGFELNAAIGMKADDPVWTKVTSLFRPSEWPDWEKLKAEYITIDEVHAYKNGQIISGDSRLASSGSARAINTRFKIAALHENDPNYRLTMMTATPISNSLDEIYTMQCYLAPDDLRKKNIKNYDAWRKTFALPVKKVEMSPDGNGFRTVTRLGDFFNLPELMRMFRSFTDSVDEAKLNLKRPKIKGGEPEIVITPLTARQKVLKKWLAARAERVRAGAVDSLEENMLSIIVDGRLAALDSSLVWDRYVKDIEQGHYNGSIDVPDEPGKIAKMVDRVATTYHANKEKIYYDINKQPEPIPGALQMIMCDVGVPNGKSGDSLYHNMRRQLAQKGIPFDAIRFIHDYKDDRKKATLFEQCRKGQVAVLFGTTTGLGTGTNVQKRLIALYDLDTPWCPKDIEQRRKRIERPGNDNPVIEIIRCITAWSHDVYSWQKNRDKSQFINRLMLGDPSIRRYGESDDATQEFAAIAEMAKGMGLEDLPAKPQKTSRASRHLKPKVA